MIEEARYVHTNLVARDWHRLASFYSQVFGCRLRPPERDISGLWLERCTGVAGAHIRGAHLDLPGYGEGGPTLEIFEYITKSWTELRPRQTGKASSISPSTLPTWRRREMRSWGPEDASSAIS